MDHSENVYLLRHTNDSTKDRKMIGVYSAIEDAEHVIGFLIRQPGFKKYPLGFSIYNFKLDDRANCKEQSISWDKIENVHVLNEHKNQDVVYLLWRRSVFDEYGDKAELMGIYSSQEKADNDIEIIKSDSSILNNEKVFEVYNCKLNRTEWVGGFG